MGMKSEWQVRRTHEWRADTSHSKCIINFCSKYLRPSDSLQMRLIRWQLCVLKNLVRINVEENLGFRVAEDRWSGLAQSKTEVFCAKSNEMIASPQVLTKATSHLCGSFLPFLRSFTAEQWCLVWGKIIT